MSLQSRKSVLVPIDFSDASLEALKEALSLVDSPSHVHAIHVLSDLKSEAAFIREALGMDEREERAGALLSTTLADAGAEAVEPIIRAGSAGEEISKVARELGCDLIVMPTHGREGVSRLLLGSVAERVLRLAHCPVLVIRGPSQAAG
jgi:nucleotide-binding universal stress UspA family protein